MTNSVKKALLQINPFNMGNPMTFKDAAIVSTIAAFVIMVLTQIANASFAQVSASPLEFGFNCIKTFMVSWAGNFITLSGLDQLIKYGQKKAEAEETAKTA